MSDTKNDMKHLIDKYKLIPHPEGGFYREVFRSGQQVLSFEADEKRDALTHIYFLLIQGQVSRFHKVIHDEVWNFYEGSPLRLIRYDGKELWEAQIGKDCDSYVSVIKGDIYQAAESIGEYSLVGCTVAPGFEFKDFSFLSESPDEKEKIKIKYPKYIRFC